MVVVLAALEEGVDGDGDGAIRIAPRKAATQPGLSYRRSGPAPRAGRPGRGGLRGGAAGQPVEVAVGDVAGRPSGWRPWRSAWAGYAASRSAPTL